MAIENDVPDLPDFDAEGFDTESNIYRPDRDYKVNPLSEFEKNYININHPDWQLPDQPFNINSPPPVSYNPVEPIRPISSLPDIPDYSKNKPFHLDETPAPEFDPESFMAKYRAEHPIQPINVQPINLKSTFHFETPEIDRYVSLFDDNRDRFEQRLANYRKYYPDRKLPDDFFTDPYYEIWD